MIIWHCVATNIKQILADIKLNLFLIFDSISYSIASAFSSYFFLCFNLEFGMDIWWQSYESSFRGFSTVQNPCSFRASSKQPAEWRRIESTWIFGVAFLFFFSSLFLNWKWIGNELWKWMAIIQRKSFSLDSFGSFLINQNEVNKRMLEEGPVLLDSFHKWSINRQKINPLSWLQR